MSNILSALSKISAVMLHPLLMPIYCTLLTLYSDTPFRALPHELHVHIIMLVGLYTCLCPLTIIGLFMMFGQVSELEMSSRKERILPLLTLSLALGFSLFTINSYSVPRPIAGMICGESVVLFAAAVCTVFWKISLHAIGAGSLVSFVCVVGTVYMQDFSLAASIAFLAAGISSWARLYTGAHTPWQVFIGFIAGLVVMATVMLLVMTEIILR